MVGKEVTSIGSKIMHQDSISYSTPVDKFISFLKTSAFISRRENCFAESEKNAELLVTAVVLMSILKSTQYLVTHRFASDDQQPVRYKKIFPKRPPILSHELWTIDAEIINR